MTRVEIEELRLVCAEGEEGYDPRRAGAICAAQAPHNVLAARESPTAS